MTEPAICVAFIVAGVALAVLGLHEVKTISHRMLTGDRRTDNGHLLGAVMLVFSGVVCCWLGFSNLWKG
jgi:hypothetical protein